MVGEQESDWDRVLAEGFETIRLKTMKPLLKYVRGLQGKRECQSAALGIPHVVSTLPCVKGLL